MSTENTLSPPNPLLEADSEPIGMKTLVAKNTVIAVSLALVVVISWLGLLDVQSKDYIDGSLKQALVTYGVARGVNAVISVLQTFTILGLGVGEVLDPINDLVERFSVVMELAIGSLVIQKILLEITSGLFFKLALTASGGLLILSLYVRTGINSLLVSRVFITLVFARFSIALVVFLNGMVTTAFITDKIDADVAVIAQVEKSAPAPEASSAKETALPSTKADDPAQSNATQNPPASQTPEPEKKGWFGTMTDAAIEAARKAAEAAKEAARQATEATKEAAMKLNPKAMKEKLDKVIPQMLNLMALFLLQTLILPLVFLYALKYALVQVWNVKPFPLYTGKRRLP